MDNNKWEELEDASRQIVIKFWETEEDRNEGLSEIYKVYGFSKENVKKAIAEAKRIMRLMDYASIEVQDEDNGLTYYFSDGVEEDYPDKLEESREEKEYNPEEDPGFKEYVRTLLKDGAIDDPKYVNSLSEEEFEDLLTNTWMKDPEIIEDYKSLNESKEFKTVQDSINDFEDFMKTHTDPIGDKIKEIKARKQKSKEDKKEESQVRDVTNNMINASKLSNQDYENSFRLMLADRIADIAEELGDDYSEWLGENEVEEIIDEILNSKEWTEFNNTLDRLIQLFVEDKVDWIRRDEPASKYYEPDTELDENKKLNEDLSNIKYDDLPDMCFGVLPSDCSIIIIKKGEKGYYKTNKGYEHEYSNIEDWSEKNNKADEVCDRLNAQIDVTPEQRMIMELRSMNGNWEDLKESKNFKSKKEEGVVAENSLDDIANYIKEIVDYNITITPTGKGFSSYDVNFLNTDGSIMYSVMVNDDAIKDKVRLLNTLILELKRLYRGKTFADIIRENLLNELNKIHPVDKKVTEKVTEKVEDKNNILSFEDWKESDLYIPALLKYYDVDKEEELANCNISENDIVDVYNEYANGKNKSDYYYYEIHFDFTEESGKDSDGYSKFFKSKENIDGDYVEEVWNLVVAEDVIDDYDDFYSIDYTQQIDEEEYKEATGIKKEGYTQASNAGAIKVDIMGQTKKKSKKDKEDPALKSLPVQQVLIEGKEDSKYKDLEEAIEKDIYRWLIDNYELDLKDPADQKYDLESYIDEFTSQRLINYNEENDTSLIWYYQIDINQPYGIKITIEEQ